LPLSVIGTKNEGSKLTKAKIDARMGIRDTSAMSPDRAILRQACHLSENIRPTKLILKLTLLP